MGFRDLGVQGGGFRGFGPEGLGYGSKNLQSLGLGNLWAMRTKGLGVLRIEKVQHRALGIQDVLLTETMLQGLANLWAWASYMKAMNLLM